MRYGDDPQWWRIAALVLACRPDRVCYVCGTWVMHHQTAIATGMPVTLCPDLKAALTYLVEYGYIILLPTPGGDIFLPGITDKGIHLLTGSLRADLVQSIVDELHRSRQTGYRSWR